jgi:hypothetical protein
LSLDVVLVEGFFEYQVNLNTPGHASQTDLMALVETRGGVALLAVEGKVKEGLQRIWTTHPQLAALLITIAATIRRQTSVAYNSRESVTWTDTRYSLSCFNPKIPLTKGSAAQHHARKFLEVKVFATSRGWPLSE